MRVFFRFPYIVIISPEKVTFSAEKVTFSREKVIFRNEKVVFSALKTTFSSINMRIIIHPCHLWIRLKMVMSLLALTIRSVRRTSFDQGV